MDSDLSVTPPNKKMSNEYIDNGLINCSEKLDRSSPELWPEKIPGVSAYAASSGLQQNSTSPPTWTKGLTEDDINAMYQLGALSKTGIIAEITKLYDKAYELGIEESKEMTRGKYLNIFTAPKKK